MDRKQKIEEEVRQTMESLDGLQRVAGNPYLYTRIKAAMEESQKAHVYLVPAVVSWAAFTMLLLINGWFFFQQARYNSGNDTVLMEALTTTYGLDLEAAYPFQFDAQ